MKKLIILSAAVCFLSLVSCDNSKKTDENQKPYGSTDTTKTDTWNSAADSSHHQ